MSLGVLAPPGDGFHGPVPHGAQGLAPRVWFKLCYNPVRIGSIRGKVEGADRELRKSGDATHFATDGPAPRRYDGHTPRTVRCVPVFVRSEKSNALVGGGFPQPAPRSANLDSAFGGMQLFATEAWRAAPLLLTHSAQLTQPTVRLPQL